MSDEIIFNPDWSKPKKLSLWTRIRLWFKPVYMSYDLGSEESSILWYKQCDGKIYIIDSKRS